MMKYSDEALMDKLWEKFAEVVKYLMNNEYVGDNFIETNRSCIAELNLSSHQMRRVYNLGRMSGVLKVERRGKPNKMYYAVDLVELEKVMATDNGLNLKY